MERKDRGVDEQPIKAFHLPHNEIEKAKPLANELNEMGEEVD
jgi:hypothetical protein